MVKKCAQLRIFSDELGKMNLNISQVGGQALIVSQFTLHGQCRKGNRPSFIQAADPPKAEKFYQFFITKLEKKLQKKVQSGVFASDMKISLINDGPVTIWLDSKKL